MTLKLKERDRASALALGPDAGPRRALAPAVLLLLAVTRLSHGKSICVPRRRTDFPPHLPEASPVRRRLREGRTPLSLAAGRRVRCEGTAKCTSAAWFSSAYPRAAPNA